MINIEYPTMGFIGVPRNTTGFYLFDFQVIHNIYVLLINSKNHFKIDSVLKYIQYLKNIK